MKVKIFFQNFQGFENHYKFIEGVVNRWLGKIERKNHPEEVKVVVRKTSDATTPHFESEVIMTTGHNKKSFFAKKDSDNFFNAVKRSIKSLENSLKRDDSRARGRRRDTGKVSSPAPFKFGSGIIPFDI